MIMSFFIIIIILIRYIQMFDFFWSWTTIALTVISRCTCTQTDNLIWILWDRYETRYKVFPCFIFHLMTLYVEAVVIVRIGWLVGWLIYRSLRLTSFITTSHPTWLTFLSFYVDGGRQIDQ